MNESKQKEAEKRHADMRRGHRVHSANTARALFILLAAFLIQPACLADGLTFDVASVKLLAPDLPKRPLFSGGPGTDDPGRLHLQVNMSLLLGAAFGLPVDQIKGPAWLRDFSAMPFYDIIATMPPYSSKKQVEAMLQNLLVDRFHLVFHHETGYFPGYELVVDKGVPKLKEVTPAPDPASDPQAVRSAPLGADGFPVVRGPYASSTKPGTDNQRIKDQEMSMTGFARQLGVLIGKVQGRSVDDGFLPRVIDKTGLPGIYTFILEFDCPDGCYAIMSTTPAAALDPSPGFPNLFVAVQKELGLRLIKTADVPMDVVVVDALDKTPTQN